MAENLSQNVTKMSRGDSFDISDITKEPSKTTEKVYFADNLFKVRLQKKRRWQLFLPNIFGR